MSGVQLKHAVHHCRIGLDRRMNEDITEGFLYLLTVKAVMSAQGIFNFNSR